MASLHRPTKHDFEPETWRNKVAVGVLKIIRTDSMMVSPYSWDWMAKRLRDDVVGGVAASPEMHSTVDPAP